MGNDTRPQQRRPSTARHSLSGTQDAPAKAFEVGGLRACTQSGSVPIMFLSSVAAPPSRSLVAESLDRLHSKRAQRRDIARQQPNRSESNRSQGERERIV